MKPYYGEGYTQKLRPQDKSKIMNYLKLVHYKIKDVLSDCQGKIIEPPWSGSGCSDSIPIIMCLKSSTLKNKMGSLYPSISGNADYFTEIKVAIDNDIAEIAQAGSHSFEPVLIGEHFNIFHRFDTGHRYTKSPLETLESFVTTYNLGFKEYNGFCGEIHACKWREEKHHAFHKLNCDLEALAKKGTFFSEFEKVSNDFLNENPSYIYGHMISKSYNVESLTDSVIEKDILAFIELGLKGVANIHQNLLIENSLLIGQ